MAQAIVAVTIPTTGYLRAETVLWLLAQHKTEQYTLGYEVGIGNLGVARQRNMAVLRFLKCPATHLLFLDDDVVPPTDVDVIGRLLEMDKDIATAVVPIWRLGPVAATFHLAAECQDVDVNSLESLDRDLLIPATPRRKGIEKIDACGAACLLIKRAVIEGTPYPWFQSIDDIRFAHMIGEDIFFCLNARQAGFEVWVDWSIRCKHYKTIGFAAD